MHLQAQLEVEVLLDIQPGMLHFVRKLHHLLRTLTHFQVEMLIKV